MDTWQQGLLICVFILVPLLLLKLTTTTWIGNTDPFGRKYKDKGEINHPDYQKMKTLYPNARFIQVDIESLTMGERIFLTFLLQSPSPDEVERHLHYFVFRGVVLVLRIRAAVNRILNPWREKGYTQVGEDYGHTEYM